MRLTTKLAQTEVQEGDSVRLTVTVENMSGKGQGMAVAIVGLPGGLTVPEDMKQLKEYIAEPENGDRRWLSALRDSRPRTDPVLARPGAGAEDRSAARPDLPGARRVQRPGEPGVPVLQRRPEALGRAAEGDHRGEGVNTGNGVAICDDSTERAERRKCFARCAWWGTAGRAKVLTQVGRQPYLPRRGYTTKPGVSCAAAPPLDNGRRHPWEPAGSMLWNRGAVNTKGVVFPCQGWRRCAADPWLCCATPSG